MYTWFNIFNLNDFDALNVPDYTFPIELQGRGEYVFRVCKGISYSVIVDGIFLTPGLNGRNGFNFQERSAYVDENRNLWVGFLNED